LVRGFEHGENKWCGYDYLPHFNIYEGIIVFLLFFKIYFDQGCKV